MYRLEFNVKRRSGIAQRLIALIVGVCVLITAFFLGLVFLSVALGVAVLGALLFAIQRWRHQLRQRPAGAPRATAQATQNRRSGEVLEASYTVIRRQRRE